MAPGNGNSPHLEIPVVVLLPRGVQNPQINVIAQWVRGGILCPPTPVQARPMDADTIGQLFVQLLQQGVIKQVVKNEKGEDAVIDIPVMQFILVPPSVPAEPPPTPSRIILP